MFVLLYTCITIKQKYHFKRLSQQKKYNWYMYRLKKISDAAAQTSRKKIDDFTLCKHVMTLEEHAFIVLKIVVYHRTYDFSMSRTDEPQVSANHNGRRLITNNCGNKFKTMFNLKIII